MNHYKNIKNTNIKDKILFIRSDMNVPLTIEGNIADDTRIKASIETIQYALTQNAKIVLATHLGRPKEGERANKLTSVKKISQRLAQLLNMQQIPVINYDERPNWQESPIYMLENVRLNKGEKENSQELSKQYGELADIFVHDAFATAHRKESSTYGVANFTKDKCSGLLFEQEYQALSKVLNSSGTKMAIIGGSKVSTKLSVLKNLASKVDYLCLGGGILNTFLMAKGFNIGKSLCEPDMLDEVKEITTIINDKKGHILFPELVITVNEFSPKATASIKHINNIKNEDIIIDIAPESAQKIAEIIHNMDLIIWNGPLGIFEWDIASDGTKIIGGGIASSTAYSVAGGGDSIAAINKFHLSGIDYISTAGGAMLEFLGGSSLPGVEIISK